MNNSICPEDKVVLKKVFNEKSHSYCICLYTKLCLKNESNLKNDFKCMNYYGVNSFLAKCLPNLAYAIASVY